MSATAITKTPPPKDGLVRAARRGLELRAAGDGDAMPTLFGYMLRFNEWTEIDSIFEGRFLEKIAPGAAKKTLEENGERVKILFNHGHDPHVGEKPLTDPELGEDSDGVSYEGQLFDTSYNRDLVPGLESGQYGSSFKFRVVKETWAEEPDPSDYNPGGIPERVVEELQLYEGGPVTFPAYDSATAGVRSRSLTDRVFVDALRQDPSRMPELSELFEGWVAANPERAKDLLRGIEDADADSPTEAPGVDTPSPPGDAGPDGDGESDDETAEEPPEEGTPAPADEAETPGEDEPEPDDALPEGAESPHSDDGSRESKWPQRSGMTPTPPWRRDETPKPPWASAGKE